MSKTWFSLLYHAAHAWAPLLCELQRDCLLELKLERCEINRALPVTEHLLAAGSALLPLTTVSKSRAQRMSPPVARKTEGPRCGPLIVFTWNRSIHAPVVPRALAACWGKISASAPFLVTICTHSKNERSILAHDQVNFETADPQPYLSRLTFICLLWVQSQCPERSWI